MRIKLFPLAALALLALGGCDVSVTDPDRGFLGFDTILRTQSSTVSTAGVEVVTSPGEWERVWDEIGGAGSAPSVNFLRDMVVIVAAGAQPDGCHHVRITELEARRDRLIVEADLEVPGAGCICTPVVVRPLHIVVADRWLEPVDLDFDEVRLSC